jgi:putative acetyltransferase
MVMPALSIVTFNPALADAFARLNVQWIEHFFRLEESDLKVLRDPRSSIIANGGQIFFAMDGDDPVGTVAAVRESPTVFELAKMAVKTSHQGRGLGEALGRAAIGFAREQQADLMFLETNSRLENAIRLYRRLGFVHATPTHPSPYERSNVYMELRLRE